MVKMKKTAVVQLNDSETIAAELTLLADRQTISSSRILRDSGEMIAPVTLARTGIMLYRAKDLGDLFSDKDPNATIRVMTTPEVLFDAATIESCRSIPLTIEHPKDDVDLTNNKELSKGFVEGAPSADGSHLSGHVVINDSAAIKLVDSGVDQTSLGHKAKLERVDNHPDYDCLKTTIRANHLAIVRRGRAQTTRIGDSGEEIQIVDKTLYDSLEADRDNLKGKVDELTTKLADAETNKLSDSDIDKMVSERLESRGKLLADVASVTDITLKDVDGMSELEIIRLAVSKLSDSDMSDKSEDYLRARLDIALEDAGEVTLSDALSNSMLHDGKNQEEERKPSIVEEARARREARYKD